MIDQAQQNLGGMSAWGFLLDWELSLIVFLSQALLQQGFANLLAYQIAGRWCEKTFGTLPPDLGGEGQEWKEMCTKER